MSGDADHDLTGRWSGIFNYPHSCPPNGFEAVLRDTAGLLSGFTTEQDDEPAGGGGTLHAIIEGRREGDAVSFSKIYDDFEAMPEIVFYSGTVQPGGDEISGRWEIPDRWAGTFIMVRESGAGGEVALEAREEVEIPQA